MVCEGGLDKVVGVVHVRKVLNATRREQIDLEGLRGILREPYFVPEGTPLLDQLTRFTTELIQVTSPTGTTISVGTHTVTWTLPTTYAVESIQLSVLVFTESSGRLPAPWVMTTGHLAYVPFSFVPSLMLA